MWETPCKVMIMQITDNLSKILRIIPMQNFELAVVWVRLSLFLLTVGLKWNHLHQRFNHSFAIMPLIFSSLPTYKNSRHIQAAQLTPHLLKAHIVLEEYSIMKTGRKVSDSRGKEKYILLLQARFYLLRSLIQLSWTYARKRADFVRWRGTFGAMVLLRACHLCFQERKR